MESQQRLYHRVLKQINLIHFREVFEIRSVTVIVI